MNQGKVILIIMDGWGMTEDPAVSAISAAKTPFYDASLNGYSNTQLAASELPVGLPEGQMGNSEVGHMNIGAGRIVYQDLVRINHEIKSGKIAENIGFQGLIDYCSRENKPIHLLGLLSDGGVHSSIHHLTGILEQLSKAQDIPAVFVHVFTDGRDTSPTGGQHYVKALEEKMAEYQCGKIASVIGRYYAMDRDKRWERVKKAYDLLVKGEGQVFSRAGDAIQAAYAADTTDEFIEPAVIHEDGAPVGTIQSGDGLLFYNFRTDRGRQLTQVLTQEDMPDQGMQTIPLHYCTMTAYDENFKGIHVLYRKENLVNGLGEWLSKQGKQQIRIAETEKYPHVTFFFNGGREEAMEGERHLLCPSPKVATYDLQPEMSAYDIRDAILPELAKGEVDFVCLNFANPDMVGHTGVFEAAVKACEVVDGCTQEVAEAALKHGYTVLITADHGNSDRMRNGDGSPHTAHTTALVPLILMEPEKLHKLSSKVGKLGDLAPTILHLMHLPVPEEMTGDNLAEPLT
ncbi:MAG: 2,3-bisphosphoglycerate-independent phosphoglycerate mutase [Bacteroidota bacterium]